MSDPHKKEKKAAVTSAVAVAAVTSMMVGGLFDTPKDLLEGDAGTPQPIMRDAAELELDGGADGGDFEENESQDEEDRKRGGLRALARARILQLPLAVRMPFVLPAWGLGSLLLAGGGALLTALSPLWARLLGTALLAAALLGAFALTVKAVFPDLPLKKILNRRTIPALLIAAAVLAALDALLPLVWEGYGDWKNALQAIGLLVALTGPVSAFVIREQKRRRAAVGREAPRQRELVFTDPAGSFTIPVRWPAEPKQD